MIHLQIFIILLKVSSMSIKLALDIPPSIWSRIKGIDLNVESKECSIAVNDLLQRTVLLGGKRLRPMLTYVVAYLLDISMDKIDVCASSIEMVHAASLSHDDVIDEATTRRGSPSINKVGGNKKAVLAGDYLLADVIVQLTKTSNLNLVKEMSEVIQELALGEWLQSDISNTRKYSHEVIEKMAMGKTASVMSWCCVSPAIVKGLPEHLQGYFRQFGINLGLAFQLIDDALDFSGSSQKDQELDLKNGLVNSVIYEWLLINPTIHQKFIDGEDIYNLWHHEKLSTGLDQAIINVQQKAREKLDKCKELLDIIINELSDSTNIADYRARSKPLISILNYLENRKS